MDEKLLLVGNRNIISTYCLTDARVVFHNRGEGVEKMHGGRPSLMHHFDKMEIADCIESTSQGKFNVNIPKLNKHVIIFFAARLKNPA